MAGFLGRQITLEDRAGLRNTQALKMPIRRMMICRRGSRTLLGLIYIVSNPVTSYSTMLRIRFPEDGFLLILTQRLTGLAVDEAPVTKMRP